jgi:6-phosphogluconolactonase (cycloisomerase 2 family)
VGIAYAATVPSSPARLWAGTYPVEPCEPGAEGLSGIWSLELVDGRLGSARRRALAPSPSFLAVSADGSTLVAVGETEPGMVLRYSVEPDGALVERERVTSGGSGPCHLLLHPSGRALYVAHYGSGSLAVLPLVPAGDRPGGGWAFDGGISQVFEHSGRGPHERQDRPHVHSSVLLDGDGPDEVLLALDLGTDELRRYRVAPDGTLTVDGLAGRMPHGTGPRHAARTADGDLLVVGELSAALYLLAWDPSTATLAPLDRAEIGVPDEALAAHVTVTGDVALVGLRGPDELVAVRVAGRRLELLGRMPTPAWPRHHAVVDGHVLVAGERGHAVGAVAWDGEGPVGPGVVTLELPAPTCMVAHPR